MAKILKKIFLYMTMTLDGYVAGPNGELDWFDPSEDKGLHEDIIKILNSADTWIMGYPTGTGMIAYWKDVEDKDKAEKWEMEIARAVNSLRTIIISDKIEKPVEGADLFIAKTDKKFIDIVNKIKSGKGRDIYVPGGVRTAQTFSRLGLIDEYILLVHPVVIGEGKRIFTKKQKLELVSMKRYKSGVVQLRYLPRR